MSLQDAGALMWLLPLAAIIIVLYILRMRRRDVRVPASFLWPERTDEVRANALIQKLRFSWLMVLQLLALSLVVIALARPQTKQQGLAGEVTVFVLDASASMGARDVAPTRFEEAQNLAAQSIRAAKAGDRIALIEAGPTPRVVFPLSSDPAHQLQALSHLRQYDSESDMGEAMRLAAALVGAQDGARIVLLSDGCFEPITNFSRGKAAVVYQKIGKSNRNMAIAALGTAETANARELYVGVKNYSLKNLPATVTLYGDGKAIDSENLTVKAGVQWGKTIRVPADVKVFEAKLAAQEDYLPSDDYAVTLVDAGSTLRVLLVGRGDPFLERALALDPRVTLDRAAQLPADTSAFDVIVFDGAAEQPVPARGVLTFGSAGPTSPVTALGDDSKPSFVSASKVPLMDGVDLDGVFIESAQRVRSKATAEVVARGKSGPLVVMDRRDKQRQVYVAFEPLRSDFPLQIAFPIFISNCLDYLGGQESANMLAVRAGSPFSLSTTSEAVLKAPDGEVTRTTPVKGNLVLRDVRQVGKHILTLGKATKPVYAYLRSPRESNIEPDADVVLGTGTVKALQAPVRFADFWRPLLLLGLLVLAGEWWLYARRS